MKPFLVATRFGLRYFVDKGDEVLLQLGSFLGRPFELCVEVVPSGNSSEPKSIGD